MSFSKKYEAFVTPFAFVIDERGVVVAWLGDQLPCYKSASYYPRRTESDRARHPDRRRLGRRR